ncbi:hypothetical protein AB0M83_21295 [Amycolatopsis sp. NPDC051106]|uniref:hypothetical protein n=1 Tax=unclassified Amycolatopsis TaxID=2618356 RepID=UPI00343512DB
MTADRAPSTTEQPAAEQLAKEEHAEPIDPEGLEYWRRACAALPPMTEDEIERLAVVHRRIDQRRTA